MSAPDLASQLRGDLEFSQLQGANHAVLTTQEAVRPVLARLSALETVCREQNEAAKLLVAENQQLRARLASFEDRRHG